MPQNGAALNPAGITATLSGQLARYKQPKHVIIADELPRNVMGKVQKAELRRVHADLYQPEEVRAAG